MTNLRPHPTLVARFAAELDALVGPGTRLGVAVSGGPDSLALLLLASAARPGLVEAATVDHGLRLESRSEAEMVAELCAALGVRHSTLRVDWAQAPRAGLQAKARDARYAALARWLQNRALWALLTGHHLDDQAETLVMRLNRGAGARGLSGMRPSADIPGDESGRKLLRPLLGWRRAELEAICGAAELRPAEDPGNRDERFERARIRRALAGADWLDPEALARSAANLAAADEALEWAAMLEWAARVTLRTDSIRYRPSEAPAEIRRRIVAIAVGRLAREGDGEDLRGRELDRLLAALEAGRTTTLRGVQCWGGIEWCFSQAPLRNR